MGGLGRGLVETPGGDRLLNINESTAGADASVEALKL